MKLQYYRKNVYGNELIYLVENEASEAFLALCGKKTIDNRDMRTGAKLGLTFEEVLAPREVK